MATSYTTLLDNLRLELAPSTTLSDLNKEQWTYWLNQALADVWTTPEDLIWPWVAASKTVTLVDYGMVQATDLAGSELWTVWSEDPRPLFSAGRAVMSRALRAGLDGANVRVQAASATAEVVVFYRSAVPSYVWNGMSNTDTVPDVLVPWVMADVRVRHARHSRVPMSEHTMDELKKLREEEMNRLKQMANATWLNAPWLTPDMVNSNLQAAASYA